MKTLPKHNELYQKFLAELNQVERESDPVKQAVDGAQITIHYLKRLKLLFLDQPEVDKETEIEMFKLIKPRFACWFFHYRDRYKIHTRRKPGAEPYRKPIKKLMRRMKKFCDRHCDLYTYQRVGHTHHDEQYFMRKNYDWKLTIDPNGALSDHSFYTYYDQKLARMLGWDETEKYLLRLQTVDTAAEKPCKRSKHIWTAAKAWLKETVYSWRAAKVVNNGETNIEELARDLGEFFNVNLDDIYTFPRDMRRRTKSPTPGLDQMRNSVVHYLDDKDGDA